MIARVGRVMRTAVLRRFCRLLLLASVPGGLFGDVVLDFVSPGNNPQGYFYVSPYLAQVKGSSQTLTLYCIDFNHEVTPADEWTANIQVLDAASVPGLQYGNALPPAVAWVDYEAAAWLIAQMARISPLDPNGLQEAGVLQYAAWKIFLYPANLPVFNASENAVGGNFANAVNTAYANAFTAVTGGYKPTGWRVVTPNPAGTPGSTQEFLTPDTPEPSALVLLITLVGIIALLCRTRFIRKTEL